LIQGISGPECIRHGRVGGLTDRGETARGKDQQSDGGPNEAMPEEE